MATCLTEKNAVKYIETEAKCGSNGNGKACSSGRACSQWGWCGNSPDHLNNYQQAYTCRKTCQTKRNTTALIETDARCGSDGNGKACAPGRFCSQWGWCGNTNKHISRHQQMFTCKNNQPSSLTCITSTETTAPLETDARCGSNGDGKACGPGRFCSQWGWCGNSDEHKIGSREKYTCKVPDP